MKTIGSGVNEIRQTTDGNNYRIIETNPQGSSSDYVFQTDKVKFTAEQFAEFKKNVSTLKELGFGSSKVKDNNKILLAQNFFEPSIKDNLPSSDKAIPNDGKVYKFDFSIHSCHCIYVQTDDGKLKIPPGNPGFGLPTNFKVYADNVNTYVGWIEKMNEDSLHWDKMSKDQQDYVANGMRHALGIGYIVYQGLPPEIAVSKALDHEKGDRSLDSQQDRNNNIWAAKTADSMIKEGKSWPDFVVKATYSSVNAAINNNGFLK